MRTLIILIVLSASTQLFAQTSEDLVFQNGLGRTMNYRLYLPEGHDDPTKEFPVLLWLHGQGGSIGSRPASLVEHIKSGPYAAILVEPEVTTDQWHTCDGAANGSESVYCAPGIATGMDLALSILDQVESRYSVDTSRRIVAGYSAGGVGAFDVMLERPGYFSAAVPISSGHEARRFRKPVETRIWATHGHDDATLLPLFSSSTVDAISKRGESPIYLEPPGGHNNADFRETFFADDDNELYPWMFDGTEPSLAQLIYDPANGRVQVDASRAPGGMISRMEISAGPNLLRPEVTEIDGDSISFNEGVIQYSAANGMGFGGVIDFGEILPPGLNLTQIYDSLDRYDYDSPAAIQKDRSFRVTIADTQDALPLGEIREEPWLSYVTTVGSDVTSDLGLDTSIRVGQRGRAEQRSVSKFVLPDLPDDSRQLEQAMLRLYLRRVGGDEGSVSVWHGLKDDDYSLLGSNATEGNYANTEMMLVSSSDPTSEYYEVDVTEFVQADYIVDSSPAVSSFRLQLTDEGSDSYFQFSLPPDREFFPELILSYSTSSSPFDCSGDGVLNVFDANCTSFEMLDAFLHEAGLLRGDLDGDGRVRFDDFLTLSANFGKPGEYTDGNIDQLGVVQINDFLILASNYGKGVSNVLAVPEPTSLPILAFGAALMLFASRRDGARKLSSARE